VSAIRPVPAHIKARGGVGYPKNCRKAAAAGLFCSAPNWTFFGSRQNSISIRTGSRGRTATEWAPSRLFQASHARSSSD